MDYLFVLAFFVLAFLFVTGGLLASRVLAPRFRTKIKEEPYECGEQSIGSAWVQFHVGYYVLALLFLIFDVESIFLFPWAMSLRETGVLGLIEVFIFIFILLLGLFYAWKKGALEWL